MAYDAITIDSSTFIQSGMAFETGLLAQLAQFKSGPVDFVLTEIVLRETLRHLQQTTKKGRDSGLSAISRLNQLGLVAEHDKSSMTEIVSKLVDSREAARTRFMHFFSTTGAKPVPSSLCAMDKLQNLYFKSAAPFVSAGEKKFEFPDAIALLSLEQWAAEGDKRVLAVSADKGWQAYGERSARIDVVADLAKALETLQEHADTAEKAFGQFIMRIADGALPDAATDIEGRLADALGSWYFDSEGHSSLHFSASGGMLTLISYRPAMVGNEPDITIIRLGNDVVVARVGVTITAEAEADFSLSLWDREDDKYIGMGGTTKRQQVEFGGAILLTLHGDLAGAVNDLDVGDLEIVEAIEEVDFGEIHVAYDGQDDYEALLQ